MTRFKVDLSRMPKVIIGGEPFWIFMPVSRFASIVVDERVQTWMWYHFDGLKNEEFRQHQLGSMICQPLCGHKLRRFHLSCMRCGYRRVWLKQLPPLLKIKMIYQVFIPTGIPHENLKDTLRKGLLTLVESLSI